jgi:hypothetical protein
MEQGQVTETSLFGNQTGATMSGGLVKRCLNCGCLVASPFTTHVNFHNSEA